MSIDGVQGSLKEALLESLHRILVTDRESRQAAEQRLAALEVTEEFGIHLTEFVVDPNGLLAIRQLSSVLLKQYVESHWTPLAEKFRPPELKLHVKEKIKIILPVGLRDPISKVRTAVAYAISRIAHWEWPENWPGLFNILVSCLSGENQYAVHGAMRVLTEFARDLTDTHLPNVGPIILQEMYKIMQNDEQYSLRTRGRAVEIFTTISSLVAESDIHHKGFIELYLEPVIPMFCEKFVKCLEMPDGPTSDSNLKTEIVKSINCLILKLSKHMTTIVPRILSSVWTSLTQCAKIYQEKVLNEDENPDNIEIDSDGEIIDCNNLVIAIFDFISLLIDRKKYSHFLNDLLTDIMYNIVLFLQVTQDQIEIWTNNPNQFIEDDDELGVYNVRMSAQELLQTLLSYSDDVTVNALCNAIAKHIEAANNSQSNNHITKDVKYFWKIYEACILALNIAKSNVVEQQHSGKLQFDIIRFLDSVVLSTLNNSGAHPLLLARCLCMGGLYAKDLPLEMNSKFLEATINGLKETQPSCIRISSIKSIYWFCHAASIQDTAFLNIIHPQLSTIFQELLILSNQPSKEILTLVVNAFSVLVSLDKSFTASIGNKLCPLIIAIFIKLHSDPEIFSTCKDVFKELSKNPDCVGLLQVHLVPTLINMMTITQADISKDEGTRGVALDVLEVLVRYSPKPLSNLLMNSAFPVACHCILKSVDNNTLQNGGEVIRTYLSVSAHQVIEHQDSQGITGLQLILQIIAQLLNPQSSEFTAVFIGKLVTTLIQKAGSSLGENIDLLLKAVLSKMQRTETPTVMQSLLMIYVHLINYEFDAVLNFLSTVPGPSGESALVFVLTQWMNKQQFFFGHYDHKVATVALCKILEYGVTHDDSRLNNVTVEGDLIYSEHESNTVRTRGKTKCKPMQWTKVPVLVKIFKLIVYELENFLEAAFAEDNTESDDEECSSIHAENHSNCLLINDYDTEDDEEQDLDIQQDSIYHLNLGQYLSDFLKNFSTHQDFSIFIQHLNPSERKILNKINIFL
ncbi:importin-9 isoform X2 [Copidosoma floridanum]|uniref:importin-9 isoform X2 n=1 Tax=Copidosoma floridanum TaxID=29053 RepID=UPI0006C9BD6C|nr:importin-9 isoform X2 [Copidosoma floridanum]